CPRAGCRSEHAVQNAEDRVMFVTKRTIPRRLMLRGLGTSLTLPWLDAMMPAAASAAVRAAASIRRLGVVYVPNGIRMDHWTPKEVGPAFELAPSLVPL